MRIMHINFAPLEKGPSRAGGIAGYMQSLALEQSTAGHRVSALSCGSAYTPSVCGTRMGELGWRALEPWRGVDRLEIVNSPNLAPSLWQFGSASQEGESDDLDQVFTELLVDWKPEIVHIHSLEGLAASCIHRAVEMGVRVIMSLHNYHPFCPQVYLMQGRRSPCHDFRGGMECNGCETPIDIHQERLRRAGVIDSQLPAIQPPPLPPVLRFEESGVSKPDSAELLTNRHVHWQPLENKEPSSRTAQISTNEYGERRAKMVRALNACDRVLAVSTFVHDLAISMGVEEHRLKTQAIGTPSATKLIQPKANIDGILRMVFLGFNNYYKGLPMLVDAIGLLEPRLRKRVHLSAFGPGCPAVRERAEAIRPRLAGLKLSGPYSKERIPDLLAGCDVGVVPSVWWDNGPQTLMEFQSHGLPVLASQLGGIPDRIQHGVNGLLFRGNDRIDAARQISSLLTVPDLLNQLWEGVSVGLSVAEHAKEVVEVYEQTLELPGRLRSGN
jgi:hypothetical protein